MLGISQQKLAGLAGLRREKVCRLESKAEDIGLDDLCRLLDAVGLELVLSPKAGKSSKDPVERGSMRSLVSPAEAARRPAPRSFARAAFIDGAKARVVNWGKIPR